MLIRLIAGREKDFVQFPTDPKSYHFKGNAITLVFDVPFAGHAAGPLGVDLGIEVVEMNEAASDMVNHIVTLVSTDDKDN